MGLENLGSHGQHLVFPNFSPTSPKNSYSRVSSVEREITRPSRSELNRLNKVFSSKVYQIKETTRENKFGANAETAMLI